MPEATMPEVLSRQEFLNHYSGISSSTLNKLEREGLGPSVISRRPWRIRRVDAEQWQEAEFQRLHAAQLARRTEAAQLAVELSESQQALRDLNLTLNRVSSMSAQGLIHWQRDHLPRLQSKLRRCLQVPPHYRRNPAPPN